jgi:3-phenylpropionate/cinnamic acid dioxygenase small subunit
VRSNLSNERLKGRYKGWENLHIDLNFVVLKKKIRETDSYIVVSELSEFSNLGS